MNSDTIKQFKPAIASAILFGLTTFYFGTGEAVLVMGGVLAYNFISGFICYFANI